jgi:hypothetical protein
MRFAKTAFVVSAVSLAIVSSMALAKGPGSNGPGNGNGPPEKIQKTANDQRAHGQKGDPDYRHSGSVIEISFFGDRHRSIAADYYNDMFRRGGCPPGLAKKNNGCMPPGQAKQWRLGYPLDPDITFYDLDRNLRIRLGDAPEGYRYVRVASDILLLAVGTNLVVDAIENLGRY